MELSVTFRHLEPNDSLRSYAAEKVSRIEKYIGTITEAHVILTHQKRSFIAEVIVHVNRAKMTAKEATENNMYASIDLVMDKIERQVKRYKDKLTSHKEQHRKARHNVFAAEDFNADREPNVVRSESVSIQTMSIEGALKQIGSHTDEFIVFRNADTEKVNVLYRRRNGDFGLIEPDNT